MKKILFYTICLLLASTGYAQINPILIEAEDAEDVGLDFIEMVKGDTIFLTPATDRAAGDGPMLADKILTFEVPFKEEGIYHLYIKLRVGPDGPNDDSFWLPAYLGELDPEEPTDWVLVNNIRYGAVHPDSVVRTTENEVGNQVFKWVNASLIGGGDEPIETAYEAFGEGIEILQIGSREDSLGIDKIALAEAGYEYTVYELENPVEEIIDNVSIINKSQLKLYPNPANNLLMVSFIDMPQSSATIDIYGLTGNLIKSVAVTDQKVYINIEDLNAGTYLLKSNDNGNSITQKFIVK